MYRHLYVQLLLYLCLSLLLYYPFITWLLYGGCIIIILYAYKFGDLGLIEVFWNTATNTIVPIVGVLLFKESLTPFGWLGVAVSTLGGIILGLAELNK